MGWLLPSAYVARACMMGANKDTDFLRRTGANGMIVTARYPSDKFEIVWTSYRFSCVCRLTFRSKEPRKHFLSAHEKSPSHFDFNEYIFSLCRIQEFT